jgi:hypothetical protein
MLLPVFETSVNKEVERNPANHRVMFELRMGYVERQMGHLEIFGEG